MDIQLGVIEARYADMIWEHEPVTAVELVKLCHQQLGWKRTTTYTVIKKLVDKGVILRSEPGFMCTSLVKREDARRSETESLIDRLYHGSKKALFSALLEDEKLSKQDIDELRQLLEKR